MNSIQSPAYPNAPMTRRSALHFLRVIGAMYLLYTVVLLPLLVLFGSDIVFKGLFLYEITEFLLIAVELCALCWAFAYVIGVRYTCGINAAIRGVLLFSVACAFRYCLTLLVTWWTEGISVADIGFQLLMMLLYLVLDTARVTVVLLVMHLMLRREDAVWSVRTRAMLQTGETPPDRILAGVPSRSFFSLRGAVNAATYVGGAMFLVVRVGGRLIYDIGYGLPSDGVDLAWMIFYYVSDVAVSVMCWALIRILVIRHCRPN